MSRAVNNILSLLPPRRNKYEAMFYIVLFLSISSALGDTCPDTKPVNFNATAYMQGTWYEVGRFYNTWESRGDCVSLRHKVVNDTNMFVVSSVADNRLTTFDGVVKFDQRKGYIDYVSKVYTDSEGTEKIPVEMLLIDYDKYVVIYYCAIDKTSKQHVYTWILSRTKKLDDQSLAILKAFFGATPFLSWDKMIWDHFNEETCKVN